MTIISMNLLSLCASIATCAPITAAEVARVGPAAWASRASVRAAVEMGVPGVRARLVPVEAGAQGGSPSGSRPSSTGRETPVAVELVVPGRVLDDRGGRGRQQDHAIVDPPPDVVRGPHAGAELDPAIRSAAGSATRWSRGSPRSPPGRVGPGVGRDKGRGQGAQGQARTQGPRVSSQAHGPHRDTPSDPRGAQSRGRAAPFGTGVPDRIPSSRLPSTAEGAAPLLRGPFDMAAPAANSATGPVRTPARAAPTGAPCPSGGLATAATAPG